MRKEFRSRAALAYFPVNYLILLVFLEPKTGALCCRSVCREMWLSTFVMSLMAGAISLRDALATFAWWRKLAEGCRYCESRTKCKTCFKGTIGGLWRWISGLCLASMSIFPQETPINWVCCRFPLGNGEPNFRRFRSWEWSMYLFPGFQRH